LQFRIGSKEQDEAKARHLRSTAHAFAVQVAIQTELKLLRNLDSGEKLEQRDKIRNTGTILNYNR